MYEVLKYRLRGADGVVCEAIGLEEYRRVGRVMLARFGWQGIELLQPLEFTNQTEKEIKHGMCEYDVGAYVEREIKRGGKEFGAAGCSGARGETGGGAVHN